MPVLWVTKDANKIGRLYAAGVHSTRGGIFVADGVDGVKPASFQRLTPPPRTQGHPYTVASLPDGALVVTYSGHTDDARRTFDNSSGVFYLPAVSSTRLNSTPAGCLPSLHLVVVALYPSERGTIQLVQGDTHCYTHHTSSHAFSQQSHHCSTLRNPALTAKNQLIPHARAARIVHTRRMTRASQT